MILKRHSRGALQEADRWFLLSLSLSAHYCLEASIAMLVPRSRLTKGHASARYAEILETLLHETISRSVPVMGSNDIVFRERTEVYTESLGRQDSFG